VRHRLGVHNATVDVATASAAWFAHVAGFIAGVVLIRMMASPRLAILKAQRECGSGEF
jgi:membrane associated rhomboid family serine protease